jgi:hypothetical protein
MLKSLPTLQELQGAAQGTLLYLSVYMLIMIPFQAFSKFYLIALKKNEQKKLDHPSSEKISFRALKYYNSRDLLALAGDRTVGNYLEQGFVFLPLLWMHACLVNPKVSFHLCVIYVISRLLYPIIYVHQGYNISILLSTAPGYLVLAYLFYELISQFVLVS